LNSKVRANKSDALNLKSDYYNMLFLNINSFMGGVTDIWQRAKQKEYDSSKSKFHEPSSKDGQLEVLCFSSSVGMALERVMGGFATKIHQSGGPLHIQFR
jgi:diacylglycerol kinase (ATP)